MLNVSLQHSIITLWNHGWSFRRIARELKLRRETVSKYVHRHEDSKVFADGHQSKVPAGSEPKADKLPIGWSVRNRSRCEPWREVIEQGVQAGLSAQRIYQDLSGEHQFTGGYDAVKRFVRRLEASAQRPFCRMEVEPGQEAQVDFGQGAWVFENGKRRVRICFGWCFRIRAKVTARRCGGRRRRVSSGVWKMRFDILAVFPGCW